MLKAFKTTETLLATAQAQGAPIMADSVAQFRALGLAEPGEDLGPLFGNVAWTSPMRCLLDSSSGPELLLCLESLIRLHAALPVGEPAAAGGALQETPTLQAAVLVACHALVLSPLLPAWLGTDAAAARERQVKSLIRTLAKVSRLGAIIAVVLSSAPACCCCCPSAV